MKFFQKKRIEEPNLVAIVEQETKELRERRAKLSHDLDLCIQGIRSIQRMNGITHLNRKSGTTANYNCSPTYFFYIQERRL